MSISKHRQQLDSLPPVAGNGLIDRRALLGRGVMFASAAAAGVGSTVGAAAEPMVDGPWSNEVGAVIPAYQAPKSLTDNEVYAVTAYILALNKLIGETDVIDAQSLPKVKMPNRENFIIRFPDRI